MGFFNSLSDTFKNTGFFLAPEIIQDISEPFIDTSNIKTTEFGKDENTKNVDSFISDYFLTSAIMSDQFDTVNDVIFKYRKLSQLSYVSEAIEEIVNESIIYNSFDNIVNININDPEKQIPEGIRSKIKIEFQRLLDIMNFRKNGAHFFKQWYIDGRLLVQTVLTEGHNERGIIDIIPMSPFCLKRIYDKKAEKYFYSYDKKSLSLYTTVPNMQMTEYMNFAIKVPDELVCFVSSGIQDGLNYFPISYLHPAIKDVQRLDILEDHVMVYRIARAPERRVFYLDVGNMPQVKAEEYLNNMIMKYRQQKVLNDDGSLSAKMKSPSILEDFFLLRRNGKNTEITTLPGGTQIGEITDLLYFQKKAIRALKVPFSRLSLDSESLGSTRNVGMTTENNIVKEEIRFSRWINKLQQNFSDLFYQLLYKQLIYKNIIKPKEWNTVKRKLYFIYQTDTQFLDSKKISNFKQRLEVLSGSKDYIGEFFSKKYVYQEIFGFNEDKVKAMEDEIEIEKLKETKKEDSPKSNMGGMSSMPSDAGSSIGSDIGGEETIGSEETPIEETPPEETEETPEIGT